MDKTLSLLVDYTTGLKWDEVSAAARHDAVRRCVDTVGCALGGFNEKTTQIARKLALRATCPEGAHVLGTSMRVAPELAGFANSVASRSLEGNDAYPGGGGHPSDMILPVFALAQHARAPVRSALEAIVVCYEIHDRLYRVLRLREKGIDHGFYVATAMAAGAAKLLKLDRIRTGNAISLAATANLPLQVARTGVLSMWKGVAGPNAARNGMFAAILAAEGMGGPIAPFEEKHGLWELVGPHDISPLPEQQQEAILRADYKYYMIEFHSQVPILAALEMLKRVRPEEIASVEIDTYWFTWSEIGSGAEKWRPRTKETADHSLPYIIAATLVDGEFSERIFEPDRLDDARILSLIDKVAVREDPAFSALFPTSVPCRMTVTKLDGERHVLELRNPKGHHDNPLTDEELGDKFRSLAARVLDSERIDSILERLWKLEGERSLDGLFEALVLDRHS